MHPGLVNRRESLRITWFAGDTGWDRDTGSILGHAGLCWLEQTWLLIRAANSGKLKSC